MNVSTVCSSRITSWVVSAKMFGAELFTLVFFEVLLELFRVPLTMFLRSIDRSFAALRTSFGIILSLLVTPVEMRLRRCFMEE